MSNAQERSLAAGGKTGSPDPRERAHLQQLQSLEDAIAYRQARAATPCPDCVTAPGGRRCDDHACDLMLIADYRQTAVAIAREMPVLVPVAATS